MMVLVLDAQSDPCKRAPSRTQTHIHTVSICLSFYEPTPIPLALTPSPIPTLAYSNLVLGLVVSIPLINLNHHLLKIFSPLAS